MEHSTEEQQAAADKVKQAAAVFNRVIVEATELGLHVEVLEDYHYDYPQAMVKITKVL